jgi:hypothetical protein
MSNEQLAMKDFWRGPLAKGDKAVRGANTDYVDYTD